MRTAVTLCCLLALAAARPALSAEPKPTVRYRSATAVYVSGGRAAGLAVGDRLRAGSGPEATELEVVFVAEHSASCRVVREGRPLRTGEALTVVRRAERPAAPAGADGGTATTGAPAATPAEPPSYAGRTPVRTEPRPWARASGGVSLAWSRFWDASESPRDTQQLTARVDLALREIGGGPYSLRLRARGRRYERLGERNPAWPAHDTRDRLYELSLAYDPPDGRFAASLGRLSAAPFNGLGLLDGALGEYRASPRLALGGFLGGVPDLEGFALAPSGQKYGLFARLGAGGAGFTVAGVRESHGGEVSREYASLDGTLRAGGLWLSQRAEVDFNRGWRREATGRATQLSDLALHASYRVSPAVAASLSYDRRRDYQDRFTRTLPEELFDDLLRQGLRARLEWSAPGGLALWTGAGLLLREGATRQGLSASAGLRHPGLAGLSVSAEGSVFRTLYSEGALATVWVGRSFAMHQVGLSSGLAASRVPSEPGLRASHWVRATAHSRLRSGLFAQAEVELAGGDDLQGRRAGLEVGYRF